MKPRIKALKDTFVAGVVFLLPLLIIFVLISKVFGYLKGFTAKIAAFFGLKTIVGISGGTIVSGLSILLLCLLCGYLVRIALFKSMSLWMDEKLAKYIPAYSVYREKALSKIDHKDEVLPYKSAAWIKIKDSLQPAFLMESMPDGRLVMFKPTAGNVKEGTILLVMPESVQLLAGRDMKGFRMAISNLGVGLEDFAS